jgi:hypothetical protein
MENETIGYTPCWLAEMNGGRDRFRTGGLCRVKAHSSRFACQLIAANRPLTPRFVIPCCPLLSPRFRRVAAPARPALALSGSVVLRSVADSSSNVRSITWFGGDLARPGHGPADRGAAGAVRGAAWRRPGHHL